MVAIADSGTREQFSTGAVRDAQTGKGRFDLVPYYPIERLAQHFENGAIKYADRNWEKGIPTHRFCDSAERHLGKYKAGQRDEDHLAAAMWNICCWIQTEQWIKEGRLPQSLETLPQGEATGLRLEATGEQTQPKIQNPKVAPLYRRRYFVCGSGRFAATGYVTLDKRNRVHVVLKDGTDAGPCFWTPKEVLAFSKNGAWKEVSWEMADAQVTHYYRHPTADYTRGDGGFWANTPDGAVRQVTVFAGEVTVAKKGDVGGIRNDWKRISVATAKAACGGELPDFFGNPSQAC